MSLSTNCCGMEREARQLDVYTFLWMIHRKIDQESAQENQDWASFIGETITPSPHPLTLPLQDRVPYS
jgi:hypothetical protein